MQIDHKEDYRVARANKYPALPEQLDAIMKMASALKDQGINLPQATVDWINSCQAIKNTFPKS